MKKQLLVLLFASASLHAYSQKIKESKFDKFDSIYKVSTNSEMFSKSMLGNGLKVMVSYDKFASAKFKNIDNVFMPVVYAFFKTGSVSTIRQDKSSLKIEFVDGEVKEYKHIGSSDVSGSDESAAIYFKVDADDKLFTTDVRKVRANYVQGDLDYEIPDAKKDILKKSLLLVQEEAKKLIPKDLQ